MTFVGDFLQTFPFTLIVFVTYGCMREREREKKDLRQIFLESQYFLGFDMG
jgi:hypothetical protein